MKKSLVVAAASLALVIAFATLPLDAGTRACNATLVAQTVCRQNSDVVYALSIATTDPDGAGPRLAPHTLIQEAFAAVDGWVTPTPCVQVMVDAGICTAPQLGTPVAVTKAQFADMRVRQFVLSKVRQYIEQQQHAAAQATANAEPNPDLGN